MNNMKIWDAVCKPPENALKKITGGRLKGMTDINPQWRLRTMTEQFGPIGTGWRYEIVRLWNEPMGDQIACFAHIKLYHRQDDDIWSLPVDGVGGSMLLVKEKAGLHVSDEGYKMALTDALSVAMKQLGVAANIYEGGKHPDSKYGDSPGAANGTDLPAPNPDEMEVINMVWEKLADSTPDGMKLDSDKIAKVIYGKAGTYVSDPKRVTSIAAYIGHQIEMVCVKK